MKLTLFLKKYALWCSAAAILLVIAVVVILGTSGAGTASDDRINDDKEFADPQLERLVRQLVDMPYGGLTAEDLAQITVLKARSESIKDVSGIERLTNLTELDLRDNKIIDITPLKQLVQLQKLNLRDNEITDISSLAHLIGLQNLNLRGNWIEDIGALETLINLEDANLRYNRIRDVQALANKSNLTERLYLEGNPVEDFAPIASIYNNIKDTDFTLKTALPVFSHSGGFYETSFTLELSTSHEHADIYFTLDGSEPTIADRKYTEPIPIVQKDSSEAVISNIRTANNTYLGSYGGRSNPIDWRQPDNVFMATVVRAKVFPHDGEPSDSVTHTYFIDEHMDDMFTLPIVSIATDAEHLFDDETGIYVPGERFDGNPRSSGNYKMKGRDWERPIHFEYFELDGTRGYALNAGTRIHGNASATLPQKSLRILSRDEYGQSWMHYPFFEHEPAKEYKRLVLRNSGNDWVETLFRDAFMQSLLVDTHNEIQSTQPVITFINGEYWGILNLRELNNEHSFYAKYGVDSDQIDLLEKDYLVKEGDWHTYDEMIKFIEEHDLADDTHYETLQTMIDIDNVIDYVASQIYIANHDWPHNNVRHWRAKNEYDPSAPYGHDGRWRYIVYDTDYGFALSGSAYNNTLEHAVKANEGQRIITIGLLENEQFKQQFINRFADLLNTAFSEAEVLQKLDEMAAIYEPEMERHIERWGFPVSFERWQQYVGNMKKFAEIRTGAVRNMMNNHFGLDGLANVTIELPGEQGSIRINSLSLDDEQAVWEGTYFKGVPLTLTASPASGFAFAGWGEEWESTELTVTITLDDDVTLTPTFE